MAGMPTAESGGTSYIMPAFGYARRSGPWTYGLGIFAQGGMGTEYAADTFLAAGSGPPVRSELGVGHVILPLAYQVTPEFAVGGTLDFMWAGLDMRFAASGAQLGGLVTAASGNLGMALPALGGAPWRASTSPTTTTSRGRPRPPAGRPRSAPSTSRGHGHAGRVLPVRILAGRHADLDHRCQHERRRGLRRQRPPHRRRLPVAFTVALGVSWQATPALLVAADLKRIGWSNVMKDFKMRYDSAGMGGSVSFAMPQNWDDQNVVNLGVAWAVDPALTLRAGANLADNPIPDAYVNPLFPATVEEPLHGRLGYRFSPASEFNASMTVAPRARSPAARAWSITHEQLNFQLMYSHRF